MKHEYKAHTLRLKLVDQYIRELFRDELPDGIKYHDADLDHFGRKDFLESNVKLRQGRGIRGLDVSDDVKCYKGTLKIMKNHKYYTESQIKLKEEEKQKNIEALSTKVKKIEEKSKP